MWQENHATEKELQENPRKTWRGPLCQARFLQTGGPEAKPAAESAGRGQREQLKNRRALLASLSTLRIVAKRCRGGRRKGALKAAC